MASSQTIAEAVENSLNAFNIVSKKNLEAVSFDQTIKCKIIDITNRDLGEYKVTDGSSIFAAYSEKTDYIKNTLVWVTIPQGDFSKQKIIAGKYLESDNSEYYTYVSPLDSFIDISQNLIEPGMVKTTGLIANGDVEEITLWSIYGREFKDYDRLAISAGFKSWLKQLNVKSGTYGLRLDITSKVMGTSQTSNDRKFYSIVLNTNDFYGDVYNFETFYNQVKVIDISMIDCIDSMSLVFYQGKDFMVSETQPLRYSNSVQEDIDLTNIWIDQPYVSLGYDIDRFSTDTVLLYTLDSATYASFLSSRVKDMLGESLDSTDFDTYEDYVQAVNQIHNDDGVINQTLNRLNKKNMAVRWIHYPSEDEKPVVISSTDQLPDNAVLHWYHYRLDEGVKDQLAGAYWEEITSLRDQFEYKNFYPDISNQTEKFKIIIELPSQETKAEEVYNSDLFQEYFQDDRQANETFYEWCCRGLDAIEALKMEIVKTLYSQSKLEEEEDLIYEEYLQALADEAVVLGLAELRPTDAAANAINEKYSKKMMNIKTELEDQESLYIDIYNKVSSILGEVNYYYSDILEFTCEDSLPSSMTLQLIRGLQLTVDEDGYNGNYRIYNDEGQILSKKESQKKRIITANWTSIVTGERALDGIERIEWYIPTANTMIQYPQEGIEYTAYDEYPIGNKVQFDTSRDRQLYTYNKVQDKYERVLPATQFDHSVTYYVKNNTTYSPPTATHPDTFIITRAGQSFEGHESGTEEASASGQVFRIKEFYSQTFVNNTIKCIVYKNHSPFVAEASLTFGPTGTNGTDYTFELEIANKVQALTAGQSNPQSTVTIIPHLYDYTGEDIISKYVGKLKYSWWSPSDPKITIDGTSYTNSVTKQVYYKSGEERGQINLVLPTNITITQAQYHILYAELTNAVTTGVIGSDGTEQSITLTTFKPIPVRSSEKYVTIDGADRVSYNSSGVNPSYYQDPYQLYVYANKATIPIEEDSDSTEKPVKWEVVLGADTIGAVAGSVARQFYPTLSKQNALVPPSYYLQDNGKQVAVNCLDKNNNVLWTQPIYIYQNSYTSALLNSWDGKLTIDEENGTILSTVVGAGAKDEKNRYNGVLMGDLRDVDSTPTFGLYGYSEGTQSFGFKIDGTAFIGKSGKGQINFDGNSGRISSLSYNLVPEQPQGMLIDLDDGYIDAYGANLNKVRYSKDNKTYTIGEVLNYQKTILTEEIAAYNAAIRPLNQWADKVLIQRYNNRKARAQAKYDKAVEIINAFAAQTFLNDYERLKYLQDHDATYLINDDVFTPQYTPSHSRIRFSTTDPYLLITSESQTDLMRVSREAYFLQTDNFKFADGEKELYPYQDENYLKFFADSEDYGTGLLFDLSHGYLMGYNFQLKSVNNGQEGDAATRALKDSYFELNSSGDPFLVFHYKNSDTATVNDYIKKGLLPQGSTALEKDLIHLSKSQFILQSFNYFAHKFATSEISGYTTNGINPKDVGAGVLLDLTDGKLTGHDFEISAVDTGSSEPAYTGSYVWINSNGAPYFRIHYQNIPKEEDRANYGTAGVWTKTNENGILINQNIDLINVSKSAWEINSKDFQRPNGTAIGKGIHFDLEGNHKLNNNTVQDTGSFIEAYSLGLEAFRPGLKTRDYSQMIKISSAATGELDLSRGDVTVYSVNYNYLSTPNHNTSYTATTVWNIINNRSKNASSKAAFDAALEAGAITSTTQKYTDNPLMVGGLFSVSWDGKVTAGWIEAEYGGKIGPYTLSTFALFTNNGLLANGKNFIPTQTLPDNEKHGIYLGRDGISFSDKLAIYRSPINRYYAKNSTTNNYNTNTSHTLKKVVGFDTTTGKVTYTPIYDFVTSGDYTGVSDKEDYFLNVGHSYDQAFQVDGVNYALKDLTLFLNGNSVLNGKTAINGNTYVYGNLQIGVPVDSENSIGNEQNAKHTISAYADMTLYGIFRSTGKTYIGCVDGRWFNDSANLRDESRQNSATNISEGSLGFIAYRNSYIAGYLKVGGSMVVGDCDRDEISGKVKYNGIENLHGDFTAYTKRAVFYGDLEVGAGFVAGSKDEDAPIYNNFPKVKEISGTSLSEVAGSGIQSKHIFLGRSGLAKDSTVQSKLSIYANTEQWGSFIAGRYGSAVELYAGGSYTTQDPSKKEAFLKMNTDGISIQTYTGKPFSLKTNGGNITIDGRDDSEYYGGDITIWAGANKKLHLNADNDNYIRFTSKKLAISSTGSLEISVTNSSTGDEQTLKITDSGITIKGTGNFKLTAGDNSIELNNSGIAIKGKGDFNLTTNQGSFVMDNSHIKIASKNGPYLEMTADEVVMSTESTSFRANKDGTLYLEGTLTEIKCKTNVRGDLHVYGNIYANNLKVNSTENPGTVSTTPAVPGINAGIGAGWIAGWLINEKTLQSSGATIGLDPEEARIWFGSGKTDYLDGAGAGSSAQGITLHSGNIVCVKGPLFAVYISGSNGSTERLWAGPDRAGFMAESIYLQGSTYFGSQESHGGSGSYPAWVKSDGSASFKSLEITAVNGLTIGSATLKYSGGGLTIDGNGSLKLTSSSGVTLQYGGNDKIDLSNTGATFYTNVKVGTSGSSKYDLTVDGDFTINVTKNNKGSTNLCTSLGKLAFADDIKKKFKLSLYYRDSSGSTEYITTLASKAFYILKSYPTTIYKMKSYSDRESIYKRTDTAIPTLYKRTDTSLPSLYKRNSTSLPSLYVYDKQVTDTATTDDSEWGNSSTYPYIATSYGSGASYYSTNRLWVYWNQPSCSYSYDTYDWVSAYDYFDSASIWDYFDYTYASTYYTSASITDIAESADIEDIAVRKKFTWNLNKTSNDVTLEANSGTSSETITLDNDDFSNPISLSINTYDYD